MTITQNRSTWAARGRLSIPKPPDPPPSLFDTAPLPILEPSPTAEPPDSKLTNSGVQTLQLPKPNEPGEFTRQFAPVLRPAPPPPPSPSSEAPTLTTPVAPPPSPASQLSEAPTLTTPVAPTPPASDPGEFTRQFAPAVLRPAPAPPVNRSRPWRQLHPANEPGEFTRQFAPPVVRPAPTPPPPASQPGEFTQLFAARPAKPAAPQQKAPPPPGEFTRQFQAPSRPNPPSQIRVPPQPTAPPPGEFTQMLQAQRPAAPPHPISSIGRVYPLFPISHDPIAECDGAHPDSAAAYFASQGRRRIHSDLRTG